MRQRPHAPGKTGGEQTVQKAADELGERGGREGREGREGQGGGGGHSVGARVGGQELTKCDVDWEGV